MKQLIAALLAVALSACGGGGGDGGPKDYNPEDCPVSYGMELFDAGGRLVASEKALTLHYKGRATYSSISGYSHFYTVSSPYGPPLPVIKPAVGSGNWYGVKEVKLLSGSTYQIMVASNAPAGTVEVHFFAPLGPTPAAEPWGLQILGPDGSVHFDTTRKPIALDRLLTIPGYSASNIGYRSTGDAYQTVAVPAFGPNDGLVMCGRGSTQSYDDALEYLFTAAFYIDAAAIRRAVGPEVGAWGFSTPSSYHDAPAEQVLVIDLSRYQ